MAVNGVFKVPAKQPVGTVNVQFVGDQGSAGFASYTADYSESSATKRRILSVVTTNYDPLAQTFTLPEGRHIGAVSLRVLGKKGSNLVIQIRETAGGFPGRNVLAQYRFTLSQDYALNTLVRFMFNAPVYLEADTEYAIVILTEDTNTAVAIAELGKYDSTKKSYVTKQPYGSGVLLSSSNASTWTSHQNMDLMFKLWACKFTEKDYTVNLGEVSSDGATDLLVLCDTEITSDDAGVEFTVSGATGEEHTITAGSPLKLQKELEGAGSFKMRLKGNDKRSPVVFKGVQLLQGKTATTADYVTRSIPAGANTTIKVIFSCYVPGNSNIKVYYQQVDGTFSLMTVDGGSSLVGGLEERTYTVESFNGNATRIKIVLEGNVMYRPYVKNLKVITI